jgi:hypothetical protein
MKIKSGLIVALAAGSIAGIAQAENLDRQLRDTELGTMSVKGHVYINGLTGERIFNYAPDRRPTSPRGTSDFAWDLGVTDPCTPDGASDEDDVGFADPTIFGNFEAGDAVEPGAIGYWHEWVEVPGDTIIDCISFGYYSLVNDPEEDGVVGHDFLMTFTENDRATSRSNAVASVPVLVEELPGSVDGDGETFATGAGWIITLDLAGGDVPTDIEIGDTNGVSDGQFGDDSIFSGVPGVDVDEDGLIDCGFVIGMRQPNVAEGDGLIDRFPELAGTGIENPDGLDVSTFPNVANIGALLTNPSNDDECYLPADDPDADEWPHIDGCDDMYPNALGSWDAFGLLDAVGIDTGAFFYGGFACLDPAPSEGPFMENPWSGTFMQFNLTCDEPPQGCNAADVAEPFDILDLQDVNLFIAAFGAGDLDVADIAAPFGVLDLQDVNLFITEFQAGCP